MQSIKTVNVDICISKLLVEIEAAKGCAFLTCKTELLAMARRALKQQRDELAALKATEKQQEAAA